MPDLEALYRRQVGAGDYMHMQCIQSNQTNVVCRYGMPPDVP